MARWSGWVEIMRNAVLSKTFLISTLIFCAPVLSEAAMAQSATGGTRDTAGPTMVYPVTPPSSGTSRPTPNVYRQYPPGVSRPRSLQPIYRYPYRYRYQQRY